MYATSVGTGADSGASTAGSVRSASACTCCPAYPVTDGGSTLICTSSTYSARASDHT
jgi:hypothetical protein